MKVDTLKLWDVKILNNVSIQEVFTPMLKALETNNSNDLYQILITLAPKVANEYLKATSIFCIFTELENVLSYYTSSNPKEGYVVDENLKDLWVDLASAVTTIKCKFLNLQEWEEVGDNEYVYTDTAQEIFNEYDTNFETILVNISTKNFGLTYFDNNKVLSGEVKFIKVTQTKAETTSYIQINELDELTSNETYLAFTCKSVTIKKNGAINLLIADKWYLSSSDNPIIEEITAETFNNVFDEVAEITKKYL